jgi:hypothetical protein
MIFQDLPPENRIIAIEDRKALLLEMRKRLKNEIRRKKYSQHLWTTEPSLAI